MTRKSFFIRGVVQGVGFRPFIYKIACDNSLGGFVKNDESGVELEVEGSLENIELFEEQLHSKLPPLASIDTITSKNIEPINDKIFEIVKSPQNFKNSKSALISPDIATCKECLDDIKKKGKYYNYFAANCTNCGPRYSIVETVPYDRANSSMKSFEMCESCEEEYNDPTNRRYHAQPISCNDCGPKLELKVNGEELKVSDEEKFKKVAELLRSSKIGAIKGIGGFHLVCDACDDEAIARLREYKNRPSKPFAVMCKDLAQVRKIASLDDEEEELLCSKEAPIVILKKSSFSYIELSQLLAPNIDRLGCFLPYTSLHHLLFEHLDKPIVATSANLGDEPIITSVKGIYEKLPFVDFVLDHNREIINGVDDSLLQLINSKPQTLRLARGYAPKIVKTHFKKNKKILAVGANQKNSIALVMDDNIIISPHIGDLDSLKAFEYFERTVETFKRFYDFEPDVIVHDKHPSYMTTKWAKELKVKNEELRVVEVGHHLAHIYACKAEFELYGDYLGFSFDGTGYGDDGKLWGGEVFVGDERKYHFRPIKLLGGAKAIKEPRRVALGILFDTMSFEDVQKLDLACVKEFSDAELKMLHQSYSKNLNAPLSSSVGRLFDALASFSDIAQCITYEGESGLLCESFYDESIKSSFNYTIVHGEIDIKIVEFILDHEYDKKLLNSMFINTLTNIIVDISKREKMEVILSGGVFQNRTLLELVASELEDEKIICHFQNKTAINDGGIALGQAYYVLSRGV